MRIGPSVHFSEKLLSTVPRGPGRKKGPFTGYEGPAHDPPDIFPRTPQGEMFSLTEYFGIKLYDMIWYKFNSSSQIVILFSDKMGLARHFFSGNRQEVNS